MSKSRFQHPFYGIRLNLDGAYDVPYDDSPLLGLFAPRPAPPPPSPPRPLPQRLDDPTWAVVSLTPAGEAAVLKGLIEEKIRKEMGLPTDHEVFVPALPARKESAAVVLMPGYVFIRSGLAEASYFRLERARCGFFDTVSSRRVRGLRVLLTVKNHKVEELKESLRSLNSGIFREGEEVKVVRGVLEGLSGTVVDRRGSEVGVVFKFRSLETIRYFPVEHLSREGDL